MRKAEGNVPAATKEELKGARSQAMRPSNDGFIGIGERGGAVGRNVTI